MWLNVNQFLKIIQILGDAIDFRLREKGKYLDFRIA
jgi:hypothetical protein